MIQDFDDLLIDDIKQIIKSKFEELITDGNLCFKVKRIIKRKNMNLTNYKVIDHYYAEVYETSKCFIQELSEDNYKSFLNKMKYEIVLQNREDMIKNLICNVSGTQRSKIDKWDDETLVKNCSIFLLMIICMIWLVKNFDQKFVL